MNTLVSWIFIAVMVATVNGTKPTTKSKNEYAYSKESQFSSPDVFWPMHSTLHGSAVPASSITAQLHNAALGAGEGNLGAAELTGTPDSYIQIPNTGDLDGQMAFCWIFNLYPTSSQTATVLEYAGMGGTGNGVKLTQEGQELVATVYDIDGMYYDEYRRKILKINTWNFVGFSYNKVWGIIDIFKGRNIDYKITGVTNKEVNAVGDVTIGRSVDGSGQFEGKVSCMQFYKKALFNKALNNPRTYCDLSIWDSSVLDWTEDVITTATTATTTATTTPVVTTTSSTTTPITTSTTTTTTVTTTTTAPTSTTTPIVTTSTSTTVSATTPTTTSTTTTTPTVTTTTTTTQSATPSTTSTTFISTTPVLTTTTIPTPTASTTPAIPMTSIVTMSTTTPTTSTTTRTATTETATTSTGTATPSSTTPVLTSMTSPSPSSLGLSQTPAQPHTSSFVRGHQPTLTDTCYFLTIWVPNHDFQNADEIIAQASNRTFTECVHMCTGNPSCLVFVFHNNGDCKVGDTWSPSLSTNATMSSRVYRLVRMDTNKYLYAP